MLFQNKQNLTSSPLVSIIMPVRFRPDLTKVALDSLFAYTPENFELILVQDGEDEEMAKLLKQYKAKIVYHKEPQGYVKAINAGFKEISPDSKYVMFLNADVCCAPGWLTEMLKCFDLDPKVGLVAPTFTAWNGIQSIEFNRQYGDYNFTDEVIGVCMLFKREAIDSLLEKAKEHEVLGDGILDERYGLGGGDDNDVCMRIKLCGYKIVVCRKSFIYHYISASFRKAFKDNVAYSKKHSASVFAKFKEKWKTELGHKPRIYIAIPAFDGFIHHELAVRLIEWSHDPDIAVSVKIFSGLAPLDNCRNQAVKEFLEDYYDYLLFIDNDIVPPAHALKKLLASDKDVIAPLCFTFKMGDDGLMFPMPVAHRYDKKGEYKPYYGKGVEETDVVTGGMFLIKRAVLEQMDRPFAFTYHANGTVIYSEDFYFSRQAKKLGYKLYTDYNLPCKHIKQADVKNINDLMTKYGK